MPVVRRREILGLQANSASSPCANVATLTCLGANVSYPLLNIFWTMFEFFAFVAWFWVLIFVITDIFRSRDLSGGAKAGWFAFVFFIPLIGLLFYLIARGGEMHDRAEARTVRDDEYRRNYTSGVSAAPTGPASGTPANTADQLQNLADARDRGTITDQEFEAQKAKILA
jgi:hypothetical protein